MPDPILNGDLIQREINGSSAVVTWQQPPFLYHNQWPNTVKITYLNNYWFQNAHKSFIKWTPFHKAFN